MSTPDSPSDRTNGRACGHRSIVSGSPRPAPDRDLAPLNRLMAATNAMRDPDRLLETVRSVYRADGRPRHREPFAMAAIRSYVRFFASKPLGLLDERHARAYLSHLADRPGVTRARQAVAARAVTFFHDCVLHRPVDLSDGYVSASPAADPAPRGVRGRGRLWETAVDA